MIRGAAIVDATRMGSQPLVLALAVAAGAVLSLALALLASVRQRRRELALLKTLGLTRRQVMASVAWQASVILVVAGLAGVPLGVAAGHWAWAAFATSLGAVPVTVVPLPILLPGSAFCWWRETCWPPGRVRSPPGPRPRPCSEPN
jgi:ABC-type antimicrobial peptide transport system permease subunit